MFPGALCASGRPERSFQLNTRIEARDSCVPGTMARQPFRGEGEPPKEQPPAWAAYPGPWENISRTVTNCGALSRGLLPADFRAEKASGFAMGASALMVFCLREIGLCGPKL